MSAKSIPSPIAKHAYSLKELQLAGGPGRSLAYEMIASGKLRAVKLGRSTVILAAEVERFFTNLPTM